MFGNMEAVPKLCLLLETRTIITLPLPKYAPSPIVCGKCNLGIDGVHYHGENFNFHFKCTDCSTCGAKALAEPSVDLFLDQGKVYCSKDTSAKAVKLGYMPLKL